MDSGSWLESVVWLNQVLFSVNRIVEMYEFNSEFTVLFKYNHSHLMSVISYDLRGQKILQLCV